MSRIFAAALALCALAAPSVALDPKRAVTQYVHEAWGPERGLPQSSVLALCQTRDGYLWVGTQEGLARFDGVRFTVFDERNTPGLGGDWITALLEDREGNLWIGSRGGGLSRMREGRFSSYGAAEGLADPAVRTIHQDAAGDLWIGTSRGGLHRFRDGRIESFTKADGLAGDQVVALTSDSQGTLWIGTFDGGLGRFRDGVFSSVGPELRLSDERISSIFEDRSGALWIGTFGGGLNRLHRGAVTVYTTRDGLASDEVWSIAEDRDGNLWVGTDGGGLNRFDGVRFSAFRQQHGLSTDVVNVLLEDREGSLWVGTDDGLDRLGDGKLTVLGTPEGLSEDVVLGVYEDSQARLWIGTDGGGLNRYSDGAFTTFTTRDGLTDDHVVSIVEGSDGTLWVGTFGGGLNRLRDGRFTRVGVKDGLPSDVVIALLQDAEAALWVGTDAGLVRLGDGRPETFTTDDGLTDDHVMTLLGTRDGTLWIGTLRGLTRFRNGGFEAVATGAPWARERVVALHEDDEGTLWIGTSGGGLVRHRDGRFENITSAHGLFDDRVFAILADDGGHLWMSCNRGIFRARRDDLHAVADGRRARLESVSYGTADGMRSVECNGEYQPAAWRTRDGRLLFASVAGVVVVDPARLHSNPLAPPVVIEDLVVDGVSYAGDELPRLPAGSRRFELRYAALSFPDPSQVLFRHRLEGFDDDWVDAGTERVARYTSLAPGEYRFRVRARNADGVWNELGESLAFRVPPFFYQTRAFQALAALGLVLVGAFAQRLRLRALRARAQELQRLVDRRTSDLQDANEQLREAQGQLARLAEARPEKLENVAAWGAAMAPDVARAIRAAGIDIWRAERAGLVALAASEGAEPPTRHEIEAARRNGLMPGAGRTLVPVTGMTGELRGALVVNGATAWGDTERQLVKGFADHLGSALDLQHLREQLTATETRQSALRQSLRERGVHTLKLCVQCGRCYDEAADCCGVDESFLDSSHLIPHRVGERYRLDRLLGEGGMGLVFQAHDERLGRDVAVKVIRAEVLSDPQARFRIEREARVLASLQHPSVIGVFDAGEVEDGSAFLVMELLSGRDLADVLGNRGPGTPRQVARLLRQAASALAAAHRAGVIHRDVKPANVFLVPEEGGAEAFRCIVVDFGLAKTTRADASLTETGIVIGTPAYMSPEQVEGRPLDPRSDLYSLAAVAYEALTGERVVPPQEVARTLVDVLYRIPLPASAVMPGLPAEVDAAFAAALKKRPDERPSDLEAWAGGLADALERSAPQTPGWPEAFLKRPEKPGAPARPDGLTS